MVNTFKCPHCGKTIEISEALKVEFRDEFKKESEEKIRKEYEEKSSVEFEDLKRQLKEKEDKVSQMREQELKLREDRRKLQEKEKEIEIETQRKIDAKEKEIEEKVLRQAVEDHRLKDLEKDKKISDLQNQLEDALIRTKLGSQQLQGEVLELDLEAALRSAFPSDEIEPVGKGVRGADVRQIVKSPKGFVCGVILWESKRTRAWTDSWIGKLKDDLRADKANIPVIVSQALPDAARSGFGVKDGVWVVGFPLILPLATILRKNLLDVGFQKVVSAHKGDKADYLYEYVTSHEFRQQLEALVEVYNEMQDQINKERIAYERIWKSREGQVKRLIISTANVVGSIQGRVGTTSLQIKGLDLPELESGE